VLRSFTAHLFLRHGSAKLLHVLHISMLDNVRLLSLLGFAGVLERRAASWPSCSACSAGRWRS